MTRPHAFTLRQPDDHDVASAASGTAPPGHLSRGARCMACTSAFNHAWSNYGPASRRARAAGEYRRVYPDIFLSVLSQWVWLSRRQPFVGGVILSKMADPTQIASAAVKWLTPHSSSFNCRNRPWFAPNTQR